VQNIKPDVLLNYETAYKQSYTCRKATKWRTFLLVFVKVLASQQNRTPCVCIVHCLCVY